MPSSSDSTISPVSGGVVAGIGGSGRDFHLSYLESKASYFVGIAVSSFVFNGFSSVTNYLSVIFCGSMLNARTAISSTIYFARLSFALLVLFSSSCLFLAMFSL